MDVTVQHENFWKKKEKQKTETSKLFKVNLGVVLEKARKFNSHIKNQVF